MPELTSQQKAAVEARGRVIVSASAGSGKTFVMIEKLIRAIESGADLDEILAVTFTKKAAAQMKEKLRAGLINRVDCAESSLKARLKTQIAKISSANISTIHSFCARLLRTYFYALDIDGGFDIMAADDSAAMDLQERALDNLFERGYDCGDEDFLLLLKCFTKKRSDQSLRELALECYSKIRLVAGYRELLENTENLYSEDGFKIICSELKKYSALKYNALSAEVVKFKNSFPTTKNAATYAKIFEEMLSALNKAASGDIFDPLPPIASTVKPRDGEGEKEAGELFAKFRQTLSRRYLQIRGDLSDYQTELSRFLNSVKIAVAFSRFLLQFDDEYFSVKKDENRLDYGDLEHLTLRLLQNADISEEIYSKYKYIYVDEYQDVNPVQEKIISSLGGEVFLVGDVKQAIYGFRGSKSLFFAEKFNRFEGGEGLALRLTGNFRSSDVVLNFVNRLFSDVMREETCGFNYKNNSEMTAAGGYPPQSGFAGIHVYGKEKKEEVTERPVYSVLNDLRKAPHSREGLAILQIVEQELKSRRYDLEKGCYTDVQPGDICILTRKNKNKYSEEIVRTLRDAGYSVSGAQEGNICELPEVKQMLDILSYIDNSEQDIPLVTAMLSPLGGFTEDELAALRISFKQEKNLSFRGCCAQYLREGRGALARKLDGFFKKFNMYRDLAEILSAGELIDKLLADSGLEAEFSAGGGEKLKNVLRLAAEGPQLPLASFLAKIKAGGYYIQAASASSSDSIKIMTMHASKGLEFPVVILADICRTFRGRENNELLFDENYGFAPKFYDFENMLVYPTVLRRLSKIRAEREELKNELNLFYVGCTRAMCKLHILASEVKEYSPYEAAEAKSYAQTFDIQRLSPAPIDLHGEIKKAENIAFLPKADGELVAAIESRFMRAYPHAESVELPLKSSASAILKSMKEDEPYAAERMLFTGEGETGTERGTAYHRFLELCDFGKKSPAEIEKQISEFVESGKISKNAAGLLEVSRLAEIMNMPVFAGLQGAKLFREREFLCRLPACDILPSAARDYVLVQGAIDLLVVAESGIRIIDYKYSIKSDEQLKATYAPQLALYKKAVSIIMKAREEEIGAAIVNIYRRSLINL